MKLFWLTIALVLAGCATHSDYLTYTGQQQDWPTSAGSLTSTHNGVTIYHGYPAQPYNVLGRISQVNGDDQSMSTAAKAHGADGVIITGGKDVYLGNATFGTHGGTAYQNFSVPMNAVIVTGMAIRIRTNVVLDLQPVTNAAP